MHPADTRGGGKLESSGFHRFSRPPAPQCYNAGSRGASRHDREGLLSSLQTELLMTDTDESKLALLMDFENIAMGAKRAQYKDFDVHLVLRRLLDKGKIVVKRAYADWERYSDYKRVFHESAIELIDIPQKHYSGKNSADIKLVVDALELCYVKEHIDTFVIASGDSDFSPLVSKLKENNKYVIGVGVKNSTSDLLIDNCDEFIFYEDLVRPPQQPPAAAIKSTLPKKKQQAFALLLDAIVSLKRENKEMLWASMIKESIKRKMPQFDEGYFDFVTFSELLEDAAAHKLVQLRKDQKSGSYIVTAFAKRRTTPAAPEEGEAEEKKPAARPVARPVARARSAR